MEERHEHIKELYRLWLAGLASEEEEREFFALLRDAGGMEQLPALMKESWEMLEHHAEGQTGPALNSGQIDTMADRILTRYGTKVKRLPVLRRWWVAASVLMLIVAGIYLLNIYRTPPTVSMEHVQPGKAGAVLMLADGSQVSLDTIQNGLIALQGGVQAKVVNGTLVYEGKGNEVLYNTMYTPKGRQFQLTLPDGTKVWLNAASSIRYPTTFSGKKRNVAVTGEVYFEVAGNSAQPFMVDVSGKQVVEVLGTKFNVNSYADERNISTTLLQGSIRVSAEAAAIVLKPGQQTVLSDSQLRMMENADTEQAVAWTNGIFNFNNMDIAAVFRQLSRWYDIEVRFEGRIPDEKFEGKMSRKLSLPELLEFLKVFNLQFRYEGRTLIVKGE